MDALRTWADVARRLNGQPRGTQSRLARALDMDPAYLSRKLDSRDDLTIRQGETVHSFFENVGVAEEPANDFQHPLTRRVPVYGYAAASGGDRIAFNPGEILDYMEVPAAFAPRGEIFIVRALGSSMEPRIFDGESLVVQKDVPPARDRDAVIEFRDGSAVVKTYKGQRDGKVFAQQYNDERLLDYPATDVKTMHNVFCRL